jgi:glycosyltransferase involved in cell wall biosynthesis
LVRIDNGVDLRGRRPREHAPTVTPIVGSVAHAREEKNRSRLVRAFAMVHNQGARLDLVGDGPTRHDEQQLAVELGISARARFLHDHTDPRPRYADMDVFALASDEEQMPLAILEAMAHGLPVVATNVGELAAMLPSEQQRFLVPPDTNAPAAMAHCIDELLADAELRARLGRSNRIRVEQRFELGTVADCYRTLYARCARRHQPMANR